MSKITSVESQKKNPRRFNIFIDGQFAFGADEDLIVNYRLLPGKEITSQDLEKLLYEAEVGKLMERMYSLFSIRQRSEKEVKDYLRNLNFKRKIADKEQVSEMTIDLLIERLGEKGLLNDEQFAKAWVDSRRRSKKKGVIALKVELYQKGIAKEIIERVLAEEVDEKELARKALEKKLNSWKSLPVLEFKKKAYQYLARKGFEYSIIETVIDNLEDLEYD